MEEPGVHLRLESSREINGTSNALEGWEINVVKESVVGDLSGTSNRLQHWHVNLSKLGVGDESEGSLSGSEITDRGQLWCSNCGEVVAIESERSIDHSQVRKIDGRNVTEGHVGSPDEIREADLQVSAVGTDDEGFSDVSEISGKETEAVVVADIKGLDGSQVDTIEGAEECVANHNLLGLGDVLGEGENVQSLKCDPVDLLNFLQNGHGEGRELGKVTQLESTANACDGVGAKSGQLSSVQSDEVSSDL